MHRYNFRGKSVFESLFEKEHEAIKKWAKAKGIDPEKMFRSKPWQTHEGDKWSYSDPNLVSDIKVIGILDNVGFQIKPDQPINTSVFEEAVIVDYKLGL